MVRDRLIFLEFEIPPSLPPTPPPAFSHSSPEAEEPAMEFMETVQNEGGLAPMAMMMVIVSFHQRQER